MFQTAKIARTMVMHIPTRAVTLIQSNPLANWRPILGYGRPSNNSQIQIRRLIRDSSVFKPVSSRAARCPAGYSQQVAVITQMKSLAWGY